MMVRKIVICENFISSETFPIKFTRFGHDEINYYSLQDRPVTKFIDMLTFFIIVQLVYIDLEVFRYSN